MKPNYQSAVSHYDQLREQYFLESDLWGSDAGSWCVGEVRNPNANDSDNWPELVKPKPISKQKTIKSILKILRNATAHGNISTRSKSSMHQDNKADQIDQIVFLSSIEGTNKFSFVGVSPEDYKQFLSNWFDYLSKLQLPKDIIETDDHN